MLALSAFIVLWMAFAFNLIGFGMDYLMPALKLQVEVEKLRLSAPFRISGFVFEEQEVVVVTLEDGEHRGRGEASGVYYLGDTAKTMVTEIEAVRGAIESRYRSDRAATVAAGRAARATHSIAPCGNWMPIDWVSRFGSLPASMRQSRWSRPSHWAPTIPPRWRPVRANLPRLERSS